MAHTLAYVALTTRDVAALSRFCERHLGLARTDCRGPGGKVPVFALGASALALFEPGDPFVGSGETTGVHHIAIAAADPAAAARDHDLPALPGKASAGLNGTRQLVIDPAATGGVGTRFCEPLDLAQSDADWIERIDHIGVASADNASMLNLFCGRLGFALESRQTDMEVRIPVESFTSDKYGVVYHTRPPLPAGGLRVDFVTVGDCELEFLESFDPGQGAERPPADRAGNTKGDQGAIARYIEKRGPGLHHLALKTRDIDALLSRLEAAGYRLIDRVGRPGSRRAQIGFVHPTALGGVLLHFVQRQDL
ncbi:MAG: VOC family protein [Kiloniellales bacterium]